MNRADWLIAAFGAAAAAGVMLFLGWWMVDKTYPGVHP
jgi:hypothetical protein